jgi:uncharacterized protein YjbJ (UPF0337 family)
MDKDIIKGRWHELKGKLKSQWGKLTDDDITKMQGNWEELEGLLQKRYGFKKEEAKKAIEEFLHKSGFKEESF